MVATARRAGRPLCAREARPSTGGVALASGRRTAQGLPRSRRSGAAVAHGCLRAYPLRHSLQPRPSNVPALSCECQREALSSRPPALVSSNVQLGSYVAEHGFFVSRSQVSRIALCPNLRSNQLTKCRTRRYVKGRQKTTERLLGLNGQWLICNGRGKAFA